MFAYIKGVLNLKTPLLVTVECNGIGYEILVPLSTFDNLPEPQNMVQLFIHHVVNESEGIRLFGFSTIEEREMFRKLISVSKIGPKLGLAILSGLSVGELINAIQREDAALIATIPGIGRKSAERMIIELTDKLADLSRQMTPSAIKQVDSDIFKEAEAALCALGYKYGEVKKVLAKLVKTKKPETTEELIKAAIKTLYKH